MYGFCDDHSGKMDWENQTTKIRKWQSFETYIRPVIQIPELWLLFLSVMVAGTDSYPTVCNPLLLLPPIPPSIRVFSNESTLRMRWPTPTLFPLPCALRFYSLNQAHILLFTFIHPVFSPLSPLMFHLWPISLLILHIFQKYLSTPMNILQPDDFQL